MRKKKSYEGCLSDEEIMKLYRLDNQKGYEKIIEKYSDYVYYVIHKHFPSFNKEIEDLYQYGVIGLMNALQSYDSEKGAFTTHCTPYVKKELSKQIRYLAGEKSAYYATIHNAVSKAKSRLEAEGKDVSVKEIMKITGLSKKIVERELGVDHVKVSYEALESIPDEMVLSDNFMINDMLCSLPQENRNVIVMKIVEGMTFKAIAQKLDRTLAHVKKDYDDSLEFLKNNMVM